MKVLFDHHLPFRLAHGGFQIQIEQTQNALACAGVSVDHLRWWEDSQPADLIHVFGRPPAGYVRLAAQKRIPLVFTALHSALGARPAWKRALHRRLVRCLQTRAPSLVAPMSWDSYQTAQACIVVTPWEAHLVQSVFGAPAARVHVVPNGIEELFLQDHAEPRDPWLVTTASILPVKRVLETAHAAVLAQTPYHVVGKPFAQDDPYFLEFSELCRRHPGLLRYEGPVQDRQAMAEIYRRARGFVLLSAWESLSISSLEAAACGCPLLLTDLPWARSVFAHHASYVPPGLPPKAIAPHLERFHQQAPSLPPPPKPKSWKAVAEQLLSIYQHCLDSAGQPAGAARSTSR